MKLRRIVEICLGCICAVVASQQRSSSFASDKPLTVCAVISHLDDYQGEQIAVHGLIFFTKETSSINDLDEPEECNAISVRGKHWPAAIAIYAADTGADVDASSRLAIAKAKKDSTLGLVGTVEGRLEARRHLRIDRNPAGGYIGNGYGMSRRFPARLDYRSVRNVQVLPLSETRYRPSN